MNDDFDDNYFLARLAESKLREKMQLLDYGFLVKALGKDFMSNKFIRVLDFGCADGAFLDILPQSWQKYGVEINAQEAAKASAKGYQLLTEIPADVEFDLIIIRGVLHHISDPNLFFSKLFTTRAVAVLANPNPASIMYKKYGTLPALQVSSDFSSNYQLYSVRQLKTELKKVGFRNFRVQYPYFLTPYRRLKRDAKVLIRLLLGLNLAELAPLPRNMVNLVAKRSPR